MEEPDLPEPDLPRRASDGNSADLLSIELSQALTTEESWAAYLLRTPRFFSSVDERLGGYAGSWTFYKGAAASPDQVEKEFKACRCFCYTEDKESMMAKFFHEKEAHGTKATQRPQDGLFESVSAKSLSDPFFSNSLALMPAEVLQHKHPCFFWRIIPWTQDFLIRMCLELPPETSDLMAGLSSNPLPGAVDPLALVNSTWALEAFIDDGKTRWSVGPIYSIQSRRLLSNFTIREHVTVVRPAEAINLDDLPIYPMRPRLNHDPAGWLLDSFDQGVMQEAIFDEDGNMLRIKARPTTWVPPDVSDPEYTLVTYPDSVYGYFPTRIPHLDPGEGGYGRSVRFEVGGLMREVKEFRRLILRYSGDGKAESLTMEWYSPRRKNSRRSLSVVRAISPSPPP
ncbi:hypothetical protein WJX74_001883 [Apatococcus lobatus]|uniref:Uncharacterized protein n=1 Tax=Apatococcus lobatus TaxID=904363 RepID=A0AAW1QCL3_9CHLO